MPLRGQRKVNLKLIRRRYVAAPTTWRTLQWIRGMYQGLPPLGLHRLQDHNTNRLHQPHHRQYLQGSQLLEHPWTLEDCRPYLMPLAPLHIGDL